MGSLNCQLCICLHAALRPVPVVHPLRVATPVAWRTGSRWEPPAVFRTGSDSRRGFVSGSHADTGGLSNLDSLLTVNNPLMELGILVAGSLVVWSTGDHWYHPHHRSKKNRSLAI